MSVVYAEYRLQFMVETICRTSKLSLESLDPGVKKVDRLIVRVKKAAMESVYMRRLRRRSSRMGLAESVSLFQ